MTENEARVKVTIQMIKSVMESKRMSLRKFASVTNISKSTLSELFRGKRNVGLMTEMRFLDYLEKNDIGLFVASIVSSSEIYLDEDEIELLKLLRAFPDVKCKVLEHLKYKADLKLKKHPIY